jgi:hypothetical protein
LNVTDMILSLRRSYAEAHACLERDVEVEGGDGGYVLVYRRGAAYADDVESYDLRWDPPRRLP